MAMPDINPARSSIINPRLASGHLTMASAPDNGEVFFIKVLAIGASGTLGYAFVVIISIRGNHGTVNPYANTQ